MRGSTDLRTGKSSVPRRWDWSLRAEDRIDLLKHRGVEGHIARGRVRPDVGGIPAPGDCGGHSVLMHGPRQRERGDRDAEPLGDRPETLHPLQVPFEYLWGERPDPFL